MGCVAGGSGGGGGGKREDGEQGGRGSEVTPTLHAESAHMQGQIAQLLRDAPAVTTEASRLASGFELALRDRAAAEPEPKGAPHLCGVADDH